MREIKFRVWSNELRKMLIVDKLDLTGDEGAIVFDENADEHYFTNSPIMQYTGLKDRNGKEIYEGDIIKRPSSYSLEVYWMGLAWGVRWKDNGNEEESIICDDGGDLSLQENGLIFTEIIGNIYENPDLLK